MRSFRQLALLALPLLGVVAVEQEASPSPTKGSTENFVKAIYSNANEAFQDLLNALPEESLHVALNSLSHFKNGVFESDRRGVERIHNENPPLATKLIVAAVHDLKKRQNPAPNNGTSPTTQSQDEPQSTQAPESTQDQPQSTDAPETSQDQPQSTDAPQSSQDEPQSTQASESSQDDDKTTSAAPHSSAAPPKTSAVIVPVPVTTTDSEGRTTVTSSELYSQPTASVAVPVTRTNSDGSTEVTTETKPAVIYSTTDSAGHAFETTSAVDFAPTKGQVLTRTNAQGSTFLTTYTPGSGLVSEIVLKTTTGADGKQSVVTSYTYVNPAAAAATGGSSDEPGSTGKPSLQKGTAARGGVAGALVLGGVCGLAAILL